MVSGCIGQTQQVKRLIGVNNRLVMVGRLRQNLPARIVRSHRKRPMLFRVNVGFGHD